MKSVEYTWAACVGSKADQVQANDEPEHSALVDSSVVIVAHNSGEA
jgi:hypothetical protein